MTEIKNASKLISSYRSQRQIRAKSMIITIYGDAIAPHGGSVWLGSLIKLVDPLNINQRLVRTTVFRLANEGWLESKPKGRRSYYNLTAIGRRRFEDAYRRIYATPSEKWNNEWRLVITNFATLKQEQRETLRRELQWQGLGAVAPGVFAHPTADIKPINSLLNEIGIQDQVVIMRGQLDDPIRDRSIKQMVSSCWNLERLAKDYRFFINQMQPVWKSMSLASTLDPTQCFLIRTLLIHEYRRVLLRDPQLPKQLLPRNWIGSTARKLCTDLYCLVQAPAEKHLNAILETEFGNLPPAESYYFQRFGGLDSIRI